MVNIQIPFIYRLESQDKGPVHINVNDILTIKNSDVNSNWSVLTMSDGNVYVAFLSPEALNEDILKSYVLTMNTYK